MTFLKQQNENLKDKDQIEINNRDLQRKEAHENVLTKQLKILRNIINAQSNLTTTTPQSFIKDIPINKKPINLTYIDTTHHSINSNDPSQDNLNEDEMTMNHNLKLMRCQLDQ